MSEAKKAKILSGPRPADLGGATKTKKPSTSSNKKKKPNSSHKQKIGGKHVTSGLPTKMSLSSAAVATQDPQQLASLQDPTPIVTFGGAPSGLGAFTFPPFGTKSFDNTCPEYL